MKYKRFSIKAARELAAPPTWVASVGPCFVALALVVCAALQSALPAGLEGSVLVVPTGVAFVFDARSVVCFFLMLGCGVLMQSAINTLNDYQDFKSGLDTVETILDKSDASLVYNQINPKHALHFAFALLGLAALLGLGVVLLSSALLLVWGVLAAACVALYSFGPRPISSLPLGELVSGVVMGGILTCATFYAMTLTLPPLAMLAALIPIISIAQIMQTNNTCDIERDLAVGRRTFPILIGSERSRILNATLATVTFVLLVLLLVYAGLYLGLLIAGAGFVLCLSRIRRLLKGPYDLKNRGLMMGTVVSYARRLVATTALAFILGEVLYVVI